MGNMGYCRFENTVRDLGDCQMALEEILSGDNKEPLSETEFSKAVELVKTCADILILVQESSGFNLDLFIELLTDASIDNIITNTLSQG